MHLIRPLQSNPRNDDKEGEYAETGSLPLEVSQLCLRGGNESLTEISSIIAAAVDQQGATTQGTARNVQDAALGTQSVSANIASVQRDATETGSASSKVLQAAQMLAVESLRLKAEVASFLGTVRAV